MGLVQVGLGAGKTSRRLLHSEKKQSLTAEFAALGRRGRSVRKMAELFLIRLHYVSV